MADSWAQSLVRATLLEKITTAPMAQLPLVLIPLISAAFCYAARGRGLSDAIPRAYEKRVALRKSCNELLINFFGNFFIHTAILP
jgi:hypothetical protein